MTAAELKAAIAVLLTAPVNEVSKVIDSFNQTVDFISGYDSVILWASDLTFNTDGTGDGALCRYADSAGTLRIWQTKSDGNINHTPPDSPDVTENSYWEEVSPSVSRIEDSIFKPAAVRVATTTTLPAYDVISENVLQAQVGGVFPIIDGITLVAGDSILVKNDDTMQRNTCYLLTTVGSAAVPPFFPATKWVLTRRSDSNYGAVGERVLNSFYKISEGTLNGGKVFHNVKQNGLGGFYSFAEFLHSDLPRFQPGGVAFTLDVGDVVKNNMTKVSSTDDVPYGIVLQVFATGLYYLVQKSGVAPITTFGLVANKMVYVQPDGSLGATRTNWTFGLTCDGGIKINIQKTLPVIEDWNASGVDLYPPTLADGSALIPGDQFDITVKDAGDVLPVGTTVRYKSPGNWRIYF